MKQSYFEIIENTRLVPNVFRMRLKGDTSAITAPGQFVNIKLDGMFLRRPISVCDLEGDKLTITVCPKGGGSENMSAVKMLTPSAGRQGVKDFILWAVENAGPNPCPPIVVGVGVGGNLVSPQFVKEGRFDEITAIAQSYTDALKEA